MSEQLSAESDPRPFDTAPPTSLRVLQFTDTHLCADPSARLLGVQTQQSFLDCVALARRQHWPADLVILSGDLAHDGSEAAYGRLHETVSSFACPAVVLPGNHDEPARIAAVLTRTSSITGDRFQRAAWQVIALDDFVVGSEGGRLGPAQLARLRRYLEQESARFTLVAVHHPPVPIHSAWMDRIGLENGAELLALLAQYQGARVVLCGHIHQELDVALESVRVLATPSTCVQFAPRMDDFGIDPQPPGYRWLLLHEDGRIETGVQRLAALPAGLEQQSGGY